MHGTGRNFDSKLPFLCVLALAGVRTHTRKGG